jgi:hypothetical protein
LVGRNGMHRYNNMDHSMLTAIMAVENIQGGDHNLWTVNADQDYHETVVEPADIEEGNAQKAVLRRTFARIDKLSLATAVGTVSGLMVLAATIFLLWTGAREAGAAFRLLSQYYVGYTVSFNGALIGMGYGFFWGFIFTWLFAYLRNLAVAFFIFRAKRKLELLTFRDFLDNF